MVVFVAPAVFAVFAAAEAVESVVVVFLLLIFEAVESVFVVVVEPFSFFRLNILKNFFRAHLILIF